ncbi:MAG: cysteine desulfurase [Eubacterium sp.]|nr:cysteine desulfurase [Eubacterium sp.]MBQ9023038.1 cysteine desulfurase [Eubacterium sp.]
MPEIYMDNAATTRPSEAVVSLMNETFLSDYGNPSALHLKGIDAEERVKTAARQIAATLRCKEKELIFTSGGTESNNLALIGAALAYQRRGRHIISTAIEHPSVKKTLDFLETQGFRITKLPADQDGRVSVASVKETICEDTILVSVMFVNNEIGSVNPIAEIGSMLKAGHPDVIFHVDAVQGYGKYKITPHAMGIDLLSVSSHKIHGPKGAGFLFIREGVRVVPILYGGGQQKNLRSGTLNVPGIAGTGLAAEEAYQKFDEKIRTLAGMRELLRGELSQIEDVTVLTPEEPLCAPHIVNACFSGVRSEVLLHALEDKGIYVSSGSACASHHPSDKSTLMEMGYPKEVTDSVIRFSLSMNNTEEEIGTVVAALKELLPVLRRFKRR